MTETERRLEELIVEYTPLIKSIIRNYVTTDFHELQDAYQEICMKLWEYIPRRYRPEGGSSLYIYFKNRVEREASNYRKRRLPSRLKEYIVDIHGSYYMDDMAIFEKLDSLADTPRRKKILVLALEGYNITEMAKILKTSRAAICRELHYFRTVYKEE